MVVGFLWFYLSITKRNFLNEEWGLHLSVSIIANVYRLLGRIMSTYWVSICRLYPPIIVTSLTQIGVPVMVSILFAQVLSPIWEDLFYTRLWMSLLHQYGYLFILKIDVFIHFNVLPASLLTSLPFPKIIPNSNLCRCISTKLTSQRSPQTV